MRNWALDGSPFLLGTLAAAALLPVLLAPLVGSVLVALLVCSVLRASVGWGGVHA